jgi:hypothetical protein
MTGVIELSVPKQEVTMTNKIRVVIIDPSERTAERWAMVPTLAAYRDHIGCSDVDCIDLSPGLEIITDANGCSDPEAEPFRIGAHLIFGRAIIQGVDFNGDATTCHLSSYDVFRSIDWDQPADRDLPVPPPVFSTRCVDHWL